MSAVRKYLSIKTLIQTVLIVLMAVWLARSGPALRFYARHAPVWSARGHHRPQSDFAAQVVAGSRAQIGTVYDATYAEIPYPGGDVPPDRGACSDVVVRAMRRAGVDLQQLMHEDMLRNGSAYPMLAGGVEPDANIDHRRCANQIRYFTLHGRTLTTEVSEEARVQWQPGDIVYWRMPGGLQHVGVVSDRLTSESLPLVIHNGGVCLEQDCLTDWEIIGHFRFLPGSPNLNP